MWILRKKATPETLYLMLGGTRSYADKVNLDASSIEDLRYLSKKLAAWFAESDAPGSIVSYDPAIEPDPVPAATVPDAPARRPPGTQEPKKPVATWIRSHNYSARGQGRIDQIVLHYTTSRNIHGTIAWFQNPSSRVSAHYIVGRDGEIVQMVRDGDKAWHASGHNDASIGIENVAAPGDRLTAAQEKALVQLCRWLMSEYKIPKTRVTGHRWLPNSTSCPGSLWPTAAHLKDWIDKNL